MTRPDPAELMTDPGYPDLKQYLINVTGLAYYKDKDTDLARRVAERLHTLGIADCGRYIELLKSREGDQESASLVASLTIGETFFFRHRELFDALREKILPAVIDRNREARRLRVWSAGCSIGAEAYTVSILLRCHFGHLLDGWDVAILGTDINREFLAQARQAEYADWALRSVSDEIKQNCFRKTNKHWELLGRYKAGVKFQYHNLVEHAIPSHLDGILNFDVILCRNVIIYFDEHTARNLIGKFQECLVDEGWLLVGHAEPNIEWFRGFRTVNVPGAVLYQNTTSVSPSVPPKNLWPHRTFGIADIRMQREFPTGAASSAAQARIVRDRTASDPPQPTGGVAPRDRASRQSVEVTDLRAFADRGQFEEACEHCCKLLETNPFNTSVRFHYAMVLEQLRRHADAETELRRVVYLDREHALAHYCLGLVLRQQGKVLPAHRSFCNVLELLATRSGRDMVDDGDGVTIADLEDLARVQLRTL